jgi:hypothetical protein
MIMRYIEHNNIDADDSRHHTIAADAELQNLRHHLHLADRIYETFANWGKLMVRRHHIDLRDTTTLNYKSL